MIINKPENEIREIINRWAESYFKCELYGFGLSDDLGYPTFFDEDVGCYEFIDEDKSSLHEMGYKADTHRVGKRIGCGFRVKAVFDNNPLIQSKIRRGYEILSPSDILSLGNVKIAVFPRRYYTIKKQLESYGLKEYEDFIHHSFFVAFYNYFMQNRIIVWQTTQAVTTRCTLKCKECNMFMPYYRHPEDISIDVLSADVDAFFSRVDCVQKYTILGGEPLLYRELAKYLQKIQFYSSRIGEVVIATNGSIVPDDELIETALGLGIIRFEINNYNIGGQYSDNHNMLVERIKSSGLSYTLRNYDWSKYRRNTPISDECDLINHYNRCNQPFTAFQDKRYYSCHLPWSAARCEINSDNPSDYLDFMDPSIADLDIVKAGLGHFPREYTSNCAMCNGCDPMFYESIPKAVQI